MFLAKKQCGVSSKKDSETRPFAGKILAVTKMLKWV